MEALYSIMYHQKILSSEQEGLGHRFPTNMPGVYCYGDEHRSKAAHYAKYVPLFRDGTFWSVTWELQVDRSRRMLLNGSDQWAQPVDTVEIVALWVTAKTWRDLTPGGGVQLMWDPLLEANPIIGEGQHKERARQEWAWRSKEVMPAPFLTIAECISQPSDAQSSLPLQARRIAGLPVPEAHRIDDGDFNFAKGGKGSGCKPAEEESAASTAASPLQQPQQPAQQH